MSNALRSIRLNYLFDSTQIVMFVIGKVNAKQYIRYSYIKSFQPMRNFNTVIKVGEINILTKQFCGTLNYLKPFYVTD